VPTLKTAFQQGFDATPFKRLMLILSECDKICHKRPRKVTLFKQFVKWGIVNY
jgi:hypothetical protein